MVRKTEADNLKEYVDAYERERELLNTLWSKILEKFQQGGNVLAIIGWLKTYDPIGETSLDALAEVSGAVNIVKGGYEGLAVPVPEWLAQKVSAIQERAAWLVRKDKERKLSLLKEKLDSFKTVDERRADTLSAISDLEKELEAK